MSVCCSRSINKIWWIVTFNWTEFCNWRCEVSDYHTFISWCLHLKKSTILDWNCFLRKLVCWYSHLLWRLGTFLNTNCYIRVLLHLILKNKVCYFCSIRLSINSRVNSNYIINFGICYSFAIEGVVLNLRKRCCEVATFQTNFCYIINISLTTCCNVCSVCLVRSIINNFSC